MLHFSKLIVTGFKSFVDPCELVIAPGMTGIVGPNGCGKSNLVEALRWVMGETSPKSMRGAGMDDVIFAGTTRRVGRNLAEVCLVMDTREASASPFFSDSQNGRIQELEIVRRIERDKGSTYRVNGKDARARDVQLLFADAASGARSSSIVSQGKVGALINAKPSERRLLLEEAAGIAGLYARRHEAELRLRAAEGNLERLNDIIAQQLSHLNALKRQARSAKRYRSLGEEIRQLEAALLWLAWEEANGAYDDVLGEVQKLGIKVGEATAALSQATRLHAAQSEKLPGLRTQQNEATASLQRLKIELQQVEKEKDQIRHTKSRIEADLSNVRSDLEQNATQLLDARSALDRLKEEDTALSHASATEESLLREAAANCEKQTSQTERLEQEISVLTAELARDDAKKQSLITRTQETENRLGELEILIKTKRAEKERLWCERSHEMEVKALALQIRDCETTQKDLASTQENLEKTLSRFRDEETRAREAFWSATQVEQKAQAEIKALQDILGEEEPTRKAALIDRIQVPEGYEKAVGAAFGEELLASDVPQDNRFWAEMPAYHTIFPLPQEAQSLAEFVDYPAVLARAFKAVGLVETPAAGQALQPHLHPGQTLVSLDGDCWRADGYCARAGAKSSAATRLEQKNRLKTLLKQGKKLADERQKLEQALQRVQENLGAAQHRLEDTRKAANSLAENLQRIRSDKADAEYAVQQNHLDLQQIDTALERLGKDHEQATSALMDFRTQIQGLRDQARDAAKIAELQKERGLARLKLGEAQHHLMHLKEDSKRRQQRRDAIGGERADWQRRYDAAQSHQQSLASRQQDMKSRLAKMEERPGLLEARKTKLLDAIGEAESKAQTSSERLFREEGVTKELELAQKSAEQSLRDAREATIRAEGDLARAEESRSNVAQRIREKFSTGPAQLQNHANVNSPHELDNKKDIEDRLSKARRERESLGAVNLRADIEAQDMEEAIAAQEKEREDLIRAIAKLRQGLASLSREGNERLRKAFDEVNGHFQELFIRLFGGGEAFLTLSDPDHPMESGLEVMASPPGKKLQSLSLLSGGEQALTALALLFAVFMSNPAPLCILDEVDAPLDDSNVDRFCSLVEEISRTYAVRFLVVTHHRLTMARMDRLFGVTMVEQGVSQMVSVDLEAAAQMRETA